jgi:SAM-dependent methyltransferase
VVVGACVRAATAGVLGPAIGERAVPVDSVTSEMVDWGIGRYEQTAAELAPVAEHVISLADLARGERVVDLATGTGNAALLAARAGAVVTGLDAASRLIDVARGRAVTEGVDASFVVGDVEALPCDDDSFDVALSVFGLIFAANANRAFDEMIRVLRPSGRALFSVWVPAGPIDAMVGTFGRAIAAATGSSRNRFAWHDPAAVGELASRHGAQVQIHEGQLHITGASPEAYLEAGEQHHPMSIAGRAALERAGTYGQVRDEALAILRQGNEDPQAFRVSSPYRVIEVHC